MIYFSYVVRYNSHFLQLPDLKHSRNNDCSRGGCLTHCTVSNKTRDFSSSRLVFVMILETDEDSVVVDSPELTSCEENHCKIYEITAVCAEL